MPILVPFRGIIEIVAEHDIGKTIAALQTVYPYKSTVFVDDDLKGDGTVRQMAESNIEFASYIDLGKRRAALGDAPTSDELLNKVVLPTIKEVTSKKREVVIWDTWRIVYQAARGHVERNQSRYSNVVTFRGTSPIIQGLISKVARMIEQKQLNELKASCELLIITHHLKDNYQNNVIVGKIPESSGTFSEVCNMRLWLRRNPHSKVPIIIFLKRPNLPKLVKGQMRFINVVPMKITPTDKDNSIWDAINRYLENPIESREPREDEKPNEDEMAMISGTLTDQQKQYMLEVLRNAKEDEEQLGEIVGGNGKDNNVPHTGVQLVSKAQSGFGFDLPTVEKILGLKLAKIQSDFKDEYWETLKEHYEKEK